MNATQYQVLISALADIQTSLDALALDVQDLREGLVGQELEIPDWISSGAKERVWEGICEELVREQAPPGGRAVAYIVIATLIGVITLVSFALAIYATS